MSVVFQSPLRRSADLSGKKFGRWLCQAAGEVRNENRLWLCVCDCGSKREVLGKSLRSGASKSCGCIQREMDTWTPEKDRASKRKYMKKPGMRAKESRRWRLADPARFKLRHREQNYRSMYGIEYAAAVKMLESQGGLCVICEASITFDKSHSANLDHCHTTGKVRGVICHRCNVGLGHFRDNPEFLAAAIKYLAG